MNHLAFYIEIGSKEELTKQPELFELERQLSQHSDVQTNFFVRLTYDTIEYLKVFFQLLKFTILFL
jgi:hypothetical protein